MLPRKKYYFWFKTIAHTPYWSIKAFWLLKDNRMVAVSLHYIQTEMKATFHWDKERKFKIHLNFIYKNLDRIASLKKKYSLTIHFNHTWLLIKMISMTQNIQSINMKLMLEFDVCKWHFFCFHFHKRFSQILTVLFSRVSLFTPLEVVRKSKKKMDSEVKKI